MAIRTIRAKAGQRPRDGQATRTALLDAAMTEFNSVGFINTNSNKIAARAGYAPQSFYNHFPDKLSAFIACYDQWIEAEFADLGQVRTAEEAARQLITHHAGDLGFRRSLRHLSLVEPRMRTARAQNRLRQIKAMRARLPHLDRLDDADIGTSLLLIERLADSCAEGEFADMGIDDGAVIVELSRLIRTRFGKRRSI